MPDDNPQVTPTLFKSVVREALFGAAIYAVVGAFAWAGSISRKLDALALRLATVETIYDAEAVTVDAHRNWSDEPGTDIPGAPE